MPERNYYIDMDGVLAVYDREAYKGDDPIWLQKGGHYFRDCKPDAAALQMAYGLYCYCLENGGNVYALTSLPANGPIFNEQVHDKQNWLRKYAPFIDTSHTLFCMTSKRDVVEYICNHELTKNDILVDDYNKNLNEWKQSGGTAIKYCNGLNDPNSFDGFSIRSDTPVEVKLDVLTLIATSESVANLSFKF